MGKFLGTLVIIAIIALIALEHTLLWGVIAGAAMAFWHWGLFTWVRFHPWQSILYAVGYALIGAMWSIIKWYLKETNRVRAAKARWSSQYPVDQDGVPKKTWQEYVKDGNLVTNPYYHSEDITLWIIFWPLNIIWTAFGDLIVRAGRRIYEELQNVYRRISNHVWK